MQGAIALRNGKFIIFLSEMVHADIEIAGFQEFQQAVAENIELLHAFGQVRNERALLLLQPGHMRITEHGDAIRRQADDLFHRVREALRSLIGQTVDQINIDTVEAQLSRGLN